MPTNSSRNRSHNTEWQGKVARLLFLFLVAIYLLTGALRIDSGDGEAMYQVTRSILEGRGGAIPPPDPDDLVWGPDNTPITTEEAGRSMHGHWGADGRFYTTAGIGWSLTAIPFYGLGVAAAHLIPGAMEGYTTRAALAVMNTFVMSLAATLLFLVASRLYSMRIALFIALAYALGTIAWAYARGTFSEPLVALGLLWAIYAALRAEEAPGPTWWALAGVGLGGALLARQATAVMALPLGLWALLSGWRRARLRGAIGQAVAFGIPLVAAQIAVCTYNAIRWGSPFDSGYAIEIGQSSSLFRGLYGLTLSPGKGLFVFVPLLLLGVAGWPRFLRKRSILGTVLLTMILLQLGLYASTERAWAGGLSWGPRHLVPVLAFFLLPMGEIWPTIRRRRWLELATSFLLAASLIIQLLGISVNISRHQQMVYARTRDLSEFFRRVHFTWAESPIPGQLQSLLEIGAVLREPDSQSRLREIVETALEQDQDGQAEAVNLLSFNVPDFWFVYWRYLGIGLGWRLGAAGLLVVLAAWSGFRLRRLLNA